MQYSILSSVHGHSRISKRPLKVLNEMYRLLKPTGMALIIDLNHDVTNVEWTRYASKAGFKGMTALFMNLAFRIQKSGAYPNTELSELTRNTPFKRYEIRAVEINLYSISFQVSLSGRDEESIAHS